MKKLNLRYLHGIIHFLFTVYICFPFLFGDSAAKIDSTYYKGTRNLNYFLIISGSAHREERDRSWTSSKSQLRLILEDFLAAVAEPLAATASDPVKEPSAAAASDPVKAESITEVVQEVEKILLPPDLYCICLGEPELGLQAANIPCSRCGQVRNLF